MTDDWIAILPGDCREVLATLPAESVNCVVTSPPYWGLRDYGTATWEGGDEGCDHSAARRKTRYDYSLASSPIQDGSRTGTDAGIGTWAPECPTCGALRIDLQLGMEPTPEEYVANLVDVFREVRRVLTNDGTVWLNLGDSYASGGGTSWGSSDKSTLTTGSRRGAWAPGKTIGTTPPRDLAGLKPKDLVGIPWRVAFALQADGWWLRSDIIWAKPNPMPESVTDRPTRSHEYVFLLTKSARYFFDADAVKEPLRSSPSDLRKIVEGRDRIGGLIKEQDDALLAASSRTNIGRRRSVGDKNAALLALDNRRRHLGEAADASESGEIGGRNIRTVWTIPTQPYPGAHFATFPEALVEPCIKAGCPEGGVVLDPFAGSGTTGRVANRLSRRAVLIELNVDYVRQAEARNAQAPLGLGA